jgi:hypothetical protein
MSTRFSSEFDALTTRNALLIKPTVYTAMTWDCFPPEIHYHILRLFCEDIITTYNALGSTKNITRHRHWRHKTALQWPRPPSCLKHISAATKVCRFFYHSIVHGTASMEHLQLLQRETVCGIVQLFDPPLSSDDDDDYHGHVHVGPFRKLAGVFWKNLKILEDYELMIEILQVLQKSSVMMLLPHLEEWVHRYAVPGKSNVGWAVFNLRIDRDRGEFHNATFGMGGNGSFSLPREESYDVNIFTIDGLYREAKEDCPEVNPTSDEVRRELQVIENILLRAKYLALQLVEDSEPHTWWVFGLDSECWFLVNFQEGILWHSHMRGVICL